MRLSLVVYFLHMRIKTAAIQTQKQILAPRMQQSIEVLLLSVMELNTMIEQELETNPLLEVDEMRTQELSCESEEAKQEIDQKIDNLDTPYHHDDKVTRKDQHQRPLSYEESLEGLLLRQLCVDVRDPLKLEIGRLIIGNIDEDGYLNISCEEIAELLTIEDVSIVEAVLCIIQDFEPLGIASRDIKECLLKQIRAKATNGTDIEDDLVFRIVHECLDDLGHKRFKEIAKKLSASVDEVKAAAQIIATFEPRPARNFRPIDPNIYLKPDIIIKKDADDRLEIIINNEHLPALRINGRYKAMLKGGKLSAKEKEFVKEQLRNAVFFIRSIEARSQTIRGIAEVITATQKEFFDKGHLCLKPMSLKDVAHKVDRNESTISRAIQNKYIDTPRGLFPLKYFFSQGVGRGAAADGSGGNGHPNGISNRSIKEELKGLIEDEDKSRPLSDQDLQAILKEKGIKVARRTISKYRQQLHILPSHLRKQ